MNEHLDLWKFLAGLGIFLFGMHLLEESVKSLSGKTFRRMIRSYTDNTLKAIVSGTLVTGVLQSSSAVSLMVLAFVGAGVLSMESAIGVIMGSNIGTTSTAWIVAMLGFNIKIESFAFPLIGVGGASLILLSSYTKLIQGSKLLIGFGFLFLGLDFMKISMTGLAEGFDLEQISGYGLWIYMLVGIVLTAIMQSSSASIATVLTALNSKLIGFNMGLAMVIGANVGTTVIVLLGTIGAPQSKKRVGYSHLIFNGVTAVVAFFALPVLVWIIDLILGTTSNDVTGLALFHTIFNALGVIIFFPFVGMLSRFLLRAFPDRKEMLTLYIHKTPPEEPDAGTTALKKEIQHLLEESRFYNLRLLGIAEKLVFDQDSPFEQNTKKKTSPDKFYENLKILHSEIIAFYSKLQSQKLDQVEAKALERLIYVSRNIMNATKNFKGIQHNFDDFDVSENPYLNAQYKMFRKRLVELYLSLNRILSIENRDEQYGLLLTAFEQIEEADQYFIKNTLNAVSTKKVQRFASFTKANRSFR